MNFSGVPEKNALGRLLRLPLKLIPSQTVMPILQGRMRGKRWITGAGPHGCWLGSYEFKKRRLIEKIVTEGTVFYDIGANAGFFSLLASVLVGPSGRVIAFEPLPRNVSYIEAILRLNQTTNTTVVAAAVAEQSGVASFTEGDLHSLGHLTPTGEIQVKMVTLDDLISTGEIPPPNFMKVDVEGAEALVFAGGKTMLAAYHPALFIDTHGRDVHRQSLQLLESLGYQFQFIDDKSREESSQVFAWFKG